MHQHVSSVFMAQAILGSPIFPGPAQNLWCGLLQCSGSLALQISNVAWMLSMSLMFPLSSDQSIRITLCKGIN
jgi:hypothetical protein